MAGVIAHLLLSLGLDPTRQWSLLRVRARLTLRTFTRQRGRIVGLIVTVLCFAPLIIGASIGSAYGYLNLPDPWPAQLLGGVLVILWLIWIVAPVLAFRLNEGLDLTRLLIYPLRPRDLVASTLFGTLLDFPSYLALPLFIAALIGWGGSWALPVVIIALVLSYAHMVIISQLVLTAGGGLLRSRRFRDVSIVILSLLGSSCFFINQGIQALARRMDPGRLANFRPLNYLQWLPPGATARAIEQATAGNWGATLFWLLYSGLLLILIAWLWWQLLLRVVTGKGFLQTAPRSAKPITRSVATQRTVAAGQSHTLWRKLLQRLPDGARQIFLKEFKAIWRTPQRRIGLIQGLLMPILLLIFLLLREGGASFFMLTPWLGLGLAGYTILSTWFTTSNMLGWEGKALPMLLVTSLPRRQIFFGKGLALMCLIALPVTVAAAAFVALTHSWLGIAGWLASFGASLATMAVTTVASVLFPAPINLESTSRQSAFSGGCVTALANTLLVPVVIGLVCAPLAALFAAAFWWRIEWLVALGVIVALLYGGGLFWLGARQAERLMLTREAEIIAATSQVEG